MKTKNQKTKKGLVPLETNLQKLNKCSSVFGVCKKKSLMGFTLVEALVAISILMMAVTGPMVVAQKGLVSAISSKDQMIAAFLAQDAIEYIKNVRDINGVQAEGSKTPGTDWLGQFKNITPSCISSTSTPTLGCNVDSLNGQIYNANFSMCVKRDTSGVFLGYGITGVDANCTQLSKFSRQIGIMRGDGTTPVDEAYIVVRVTWGTGADQVLEITSYIYNYWGNL
ncbi:MAG: hypothetical protein WCC74_00095 [Minisyncoccia bacterium]